MIKHNFGKDYRKSVLTLVLYQLINIVLFKCEL